MALNKKEIVDFLKSKDDSLFESADRVRKKNVGDGVHLRGLVEFSNYCSKNCLYCGIRLDNSNIKRYRLSKDKIQYYAKNAVELGLKTIVLQSGEDNHYSVNDMTDIIRSIKEYNVALTLSIGEKNKEAYHAFKEAGADRFLIRIETTDKELYKKMHPYADWERRKQCLSDLKTLGYEVGCGSLVGLPGQTIESIADDILFFKEIGADMVGIGPFIPNSETPLKDETKGSFDLTLRVVALTRLMLPKANIPATTAMETLCQEGQGGRLITLQCGANVVMPNMVDYEINKNYQLYNEKSSNILGVENTLNEIKKGIKSIGREIM